MSKSSVVMDASAILAWMNNENGSEQVAELLLKGAAVSTVNVTEVMAKQSETGVSSSKTMSYLGLVGIEMMDFNTEDALIAADLRQHTRSYGLSLGDRACLALGIRLQLPVVTADRAWADLVLGVEAKRPEWSGLEIVLIR
ncbi:type II toxin-antitoxin system VapC family toxin [Paenibacillus koleovorans]|uniref:type II toxin-antitoxin system VapC family toxin n=1 Tax=Paenibacillus koleovorans TaxID=121608 RepID=UPI000FD895A2|nr:type II toxin-antitoxin system VapC family toxin [Paenibacillus koleovorans]